jgi:redox-sensitive bicupin YhaK (pirin superfamily)
MLEGSFHHEDFAGHKGKINPGDLQWMTAGKGIVHSEMPDSKDVLSHGLQLWVNLSKNDKMVNPSYQELLDKDIPRISPSEGISVKVIAGKAFGIANAVITKTPTLMLDFSMQKGTAINLVLCTLI